MIEKGAKGKIYKQYFCNKINLIIIQGFGSGSALFKENIRIPIRIQNSEVLEATVYKCSRGGPWTLTMEAWRLKIEPWRVS